MYVLYDVRQSNQSILFSHHTSSLRFFVENNSAKLILIFGIEYLKLVLAFIEIYLYGVLFRYMFSISCVKQTYFLQIINLFEKSFQMSGHIAMFIQYLNSTVFPQFIGQAILPPILLVQKMKFPTILEMESTSYLINKIM